MGGVRPTSFFGRRAVVDLPDDIALTTQVFLFWLVATLWRRAANASSANLSSMSAFSSS